MSLLRTESRRGRTTQLATLAILSSCQSRSPGINSRSSRNWRGRNLERSLAVPPHGCTRRDHRSRIWCVPQLLVAISRSTVPQWRLMTSSFCCFLFSSEMETSAGESADSAAPSKKKKKKKKETQASADLECSSTTASPTSNVRPAINGHIPIAPILPFDLSELRGRKPVIYLYPPSRLSDVIVELHLTSSWNFSAVYPSPQSAVPSVANHIGAQSLTWAIEAEPDGTLVEKTTGVEVTYLYWEAMYVCSLVLSAAIKIDVDTGFLAQNPILSRQTSLVQLRR